LNLEPYVPIAWAMLLALGFCGLFTALGIFVGPKRSTAIKSTPFECGSDPVGSPRARMSVKFYKVAILFLVFDVEAAFLYPWAILFRDLSFPAPGTTSFYGLGVMLIFLAILVVAFAYEWRKRGFGWD
jgi:NADH-quinone oxidoreductase subunit A